LAAEARAPSKSPAPRDNTARALIDGAQRYPIAARRDRSLLRPAPRSVHALVCDAAQRQGLVCARSLGRAGLAVGLLENHPDAPAFHSRWCASTGVVPDCASAPDEFVEIVLASARRQKAGVLFPLHDGSIDALRARRSEVEQDVALALATEPALEIAVSKTRTLALAAELGIGVPGGVAVRNEDDVRAAADDFGFPLVVKPGTSWVQSGPGGRRLACTLVVDLDEAFAAVDALAQVGGAPILQEWLVGSREAVSLFRAEGRIWARFAQVASRMFPPLGGASVVRESIPLPADVTDAAERLVDACDLDGYSEIEFRRDANGRPRLMEINPRLSASVEIAVRAGVDFPLLLYRWAAGEKVQQSPTARAGVRMRWLGGDIKWLKTTLASQGRPEADGTLRAIGSFCGAFLRPASYDYLDRHDLGPAFAATSSWMLRRAHAAAPTRLLDLSTERSL
jgi:predicted ATP-grasp superfamily ATP-dependent carboligase